MQVVMRDETHHLRSRPKSWLCIVNQSNQGKVFEAGEDHPENCEHCKRGENMRNTKLWMNILWVLIVVYAVAEVVISVMPQSIPPAFLVLSLIHISEPTRLGM